MYVGLCVCMYVNVHGPYVYSGLFSVIIMQYKGDLQHRCDIVK